MPAEHSPEIQAKIKLRRKAMKLRRAGLAYEAIASRLGISTSAAFQLVAKHLAILQKRCREDADEVRALELARLDSLFAIAYRTAADTRSDPGDRLRAVAQAVAVAARRARLMGLDAPAKLAPTDPSGELAYNPANQLSDQQRLERIAELFAAAQRGSHESKGG
jgi:hypothetical protein